MIGSIPQRYGYFYTKFFTFHIDFYIKLQYTSSEKAWQRSDSKLKNLIISLLLIPLLFFLQGCLNDNQDESDVVRTPLITPMPTTVMSPIPEPEPETECRHFWRTADCFNPATCFDCGEIRGEPLEHEWTEANFQQAPECIRCGEINGSPTEPNFTRLGHRINSTSGRPYTYETITNIDPSLSTIGTASLLYVNIFEYSADYPAKRGYEYIQARLMLIFDDENATVYGYSYMTGHLDFFGFDAGEASIAHEDLEESDMPEFKIANKKLNFYGVDYEYYIKYELVHNTWVDRTAYVIRDYTFLVPASYDGIVIYITNAANWADGSGRTITDSFDSKTLFFRLGTNTG
jgi:hypothetical protein